MVMFACVGCGGIASDSNSRSDASALSGTVAPDAAQSATQAVAAVTAADLNSEFGAMRDRAGGSLEIAWGPVKRPDRVQTLGSVTDEQSWSSLKVPVALAALRGGSGAEHSRDLDLALTVSDNDAARRLWQSLGSAEQAADAVDAVLARGGDTRTRAGRADGATVPFGLTRWTVPDAARFATGLPCLSDGAPVWDRMGRVTADQRWGLGRVEGAHFKGGWGQSPHGYLMRQVGVLPLSDGSQVAVAMATQPTGNSHPAGAATLDDAARWLHGKLGPADGGRCG